jgi:RNA polymerase sigma factor (sigma-70 family)
MEAARSFGAWPEQLRMRRFEQECERLRPLGEAYVMRRFGGSLGGADAEDAVAEVIIRLHRQAAAGRAPDNLRAAFFTSVRNAAVDQLRSRAVRPTVELAAVAESPMDGPGPDQRAELREDSMRLQEALGRMRANYREAIMLRFGLGLTVPQIAEQLEISLPAAKKLVLRSTAQARKRLEAIDGTEFCEEMRGFAQRALIDKEVSDLGDEGEVELLKAHFAHCGSCRSFVTSLRRSVHEFGSGLVLAGFASHEAGLSLRFGAWFDNLRHGGHLVAEKSRMLAYKASGGLQPDNGAGAGAFAGATQKIAAVCTVGAASAATCVATGIVGPGLGVATAPHPVDHPHRRAVAQVRKAPTPVRHPRISYTAPQGEAEPVGGQATDGTAPRPRGAGSEPSKDLNPTPKHHAEPGPKSGSAAQTEQSEFGFEAEAEAETQPTTGSPPPEEAVPPVADSRPIEQSPPATGSGSESSKSTGRPSGGGTEEFGFGG